MNKREIKFRLWDGKKMITTENPFIDAGSGAKEYAILLKGIPVLFSVYGFEPSKVVEAKVMQFTGMLDKNGKEIWEGDIVKAAMMHRGVAGIPFTAFIFYNEAIGAFRIGYDSLGGGAQDEIYFRYQIEVIGNVCENAELLKQE